MPLIIISDPASLKEATEGMLRAAWDQPQFEALMQKAIQDKRINRERLLLLGFTYGASFAITQVMAGRIKAVGEG